MSLEQELIDLINSEQPVEDVAATQTQVAVAELPAEPVVSEPVDIDSALDQELQSFDSGSISATPGLPTRTVNVGKRLLKNYLMGAETAERDFDKLLGQDSPLDRRIELEEAANILDKFARVTGEYTAPLPQLMGVPGLGQAITQSTKVVGPALSKAANAPVIGKFFQAMGKATQGLKEGVSKAIATTTGVADDVVLRFMDRGRKAWKPEYFNDKAISNTNRTKSLNALSEGFKQIGDEFDKTVSPLLKSKEELKNVNRITGEFIQELANKDVVNIKPDKKGKLLVFTEGLGATKANLKKPLEGIVDTLEDLSKKPTLEKAHLARKKIDRIIQGSNIPDVFEAKNAVTKLRNDIVEQMPEEYKNANAKFRNLFKLRDDIKLGGKLSKTNVESTLLNIMGKGKSELNEGLKQLDAILPQNKKFYDDVLDELSVKQMSSWKPSGIGANVATGLLISGAIADPRLLSLISATSPRINSMLIRGGAAVGRQPIKRPVGTARTLFGATVEEEPTPQ